MSDRFRQVLLPEPEDDEWGEDSPFAAFADSPEPERSESPPARPRSKRGLTPAEVSAIREQDRLVTQLIGVPLHLGPAERRRKSAVALVNRIAEGADMAPEELLTSILNTGVSQRRTSADGGEIYGRSRRQSAAPLSPTQPDASEEVEVLGEMLRRKTEYLNMVLRREHVVTLKHRDNVSRLQRELVGARQESLELKAQLTMLALPESTLRVANDAFAHAQSALRDVLDESANRLAEQEAAAGRARDDYQEVQRRYQELLSRAGHTGDDVAAQRLSKRLLRKAREIMPRMQALRQTWRVLQRLWWGFDGDLREALIGPIQRAVGEGVLPAPAADPDDTSADPAAAPAAAVSFSPRRAGQDDSPLSPGVLGSGSMRQSPPVRKGSMMTLMGNTPGSATAQRALLRRKSAGARVLGQAAGRSQSPGDSDGSRSRSQLPQQRRPSAATVSWAEARELRVRAARLEDEVRKGKRMAALLEARRREHQALSNRRCEVSERLTTLAQQTADVYRNRLAKLRQEVAAALAARPSGAAAAGPQRGVGGSTADTRLRMCLAEMDSLLATDPLSDAQQAAAEGDGAWGDILAQRRELHAELQSIRAARTTEDPEELRQWMQANAPETPTPADSRRDSAAGQPTVSSATGSGGPADGAPQRPRQSTGGAMAPTDVPTAAPAVAAAAAAAEAAPAPPDPAAAQAGAPASGFLAEGGHTPPGAETPPLQAGDPVRAARGIAFKDGRTVAAGAVGIVTKVPGDAAGSPAEVRIAGVMFDAQPGDLDPVDLSTSPADVTAAFQQLQQLQLPHGGRGSPLPPPEQPSPAFVAAAARERAALLDELAARDAELALLREELEAVARDGYVPPPGAHLGVGQLTIARRRMLARIGRWKEQEEEKSAGSARSQWQSRSVVGLLSLKRSDSGTQTDPPSPHSSVTRRQRPFSAALQSSAASSAGTLGPRPSSAPFRDPAPAPAAAGKASQRRRHKRPAPLDPEDCGCSVCSAPAAYTTQHQHLLRQPPEIDGPTDDPAPSPARPVPALHSQVRERVSIIASALAAGDGPPPWQQGTMPTTPAQQQWAPQQGASRPQSAATVVSGGRGERPPVPSRPPSRPGSAAQPQQTGALTPCARSPPQLRRRPNSAPPTQLPESVGAPSSPLRVLPSDSPLGRGPSMTPQRDRHQGQRQAAAESRGSGSARGGFTASSSSSSGPLSPRGPLQSGGRLLDDARVLLSLSTQMMMDAVATHRTPGRIVAQMRPASAALPTPVTGGSAERSEGATTLPFARPASAGQHPLHPAQQQQRRHQLAILTRLGEGADFSAEPGAAPRPLQLGAPPAVPRSSTDWTQWEVQIRAAAERRRIRAREADSNIRRSELNRSRLQREWETLQSSTALRKAQRESMPGMEARASPPKRPAAGALPPVGDAPAKCLAADWQDLGGALEWLMRAAGAFEQLFAKPHLAADSPVALEDTPVQAGGMESPRPTPEALMAAFGALYHQARRCLIEAVIVPAGDLEIGGDWLLKRLRELYRSRGQKQPAGWLFNSPPPGRPGPRNSPSRDEEAEIAEGVAAAVREARRRARSPPPAVERQQQKGDGVPRAPSSGSLTGGVRRGPPPRPASAGVPNSPSIPGSSVDVSLELRGHPHLRQKDAALPLVGAPPEVPA
eukprot:TRINITY_DN5364_c0_g1_i1.p1 TRINITY_DN5364_c0_g1~~TRINITY_DN5364_c0_g1_i1.p1  ORF type:complete len:1669 (+),score=432.21 TRINITY_DN5364_c0_g1_i1:68-5008(+)